MNFETLVGLVASICTAVAMLPQLIKIIKEKEAEAVSLAMAGILITGLAGWIYYGFLKNDWIIIISNSFSILINILVAFFSYQYKKEAVE